jgi:glycosyltransferase involved in cell wall biosynthesis
MSTSLSVEAYSTFVGPLARDLLGSEYLDCHAVCVPSRSEPFGMVVIEAMAAGRPVIGTNIGGIPFTVVHEKSGLLVPKDAPGELADALERASQNPHMMKVMGRQAYDLCRKRFTWEGVTQQLVEAIDSCIVSTLTTARSR